MDARGIPSGGASPLDRFQQVRDLARKKIDASSSTRGDENLARLADLLRKKQAELGRGVALDRPQAAQRAEAAQRLEQPPAGGIAPGVGGLAAYGRAGGAERKQSGPGLGRYVDLTA